MTRVFINGRFFTQRQTGVQRMALETVRAIDALLGSEAGLGLEVTLLAPDGATVPTFSHIAVRNGGLFAGGYGWEQLDWCNNARRSAAEARGVANASVRVTRA